MGGRGGKSNISGSSSIRATVKVSNAQNTNNQTSNQTSAEDLIEASQMDSIYGNNTSSMFVNMTEDELMSAYNNSRNVDMPNHIDDISDETQKFVYANGLNKKPTVLDNASFDNFLKTNKISDDEILIREVDGVSFSSKGVTYNYTANDITDMFKTSDINYIGGKRGGQVYGAGTYFGMAGRNGSTGYGSGVTMMAVLNPKTAKVISRNNIDSEWSKFTRNKPKLSKISTSSSTYSIRALMMGYNVITSALNNKNKSYGDYYNIIDRSAVVVRANNR